MDLPALLWKVPPLPHLDWPWWSKIDSEVKVGIKDAFEAAFWTGVGQTLPYVASALVLGLAIGLIINLKSSQRNT